MDIPNSGPSQQAVAAEAISDFIDALEADPAIEPHGLIIQRNGRRIAEGYWAPHSADRSRLVYSLSKTFTGTALGLLLGEGRLGLDDLVSDHLPDYFTSTDERTRRIRVRHIASMATGHDREMLLEALVADPEDPARGFFQIAPDAEPGTLFAYNQPPVLALATILQQLAGERLVDYLRPRLLNPLGIGDLRWSQHSPGVDLGFSGVHTNLDAIARLGQLYLDDGVCNGARLLPADWVASASSVQIENPQRDQPDWAQGYGFQLWMSRHGYRGDGAFGQYMVVLPEFRTVIALFSCTEDMQPVLDLMWKHLLPAMGSPDTAAKRPTSADLALASRLTDLALPTVTQRLGGGPVRLDPTVGPLLPAPTRARSHRTVQSIQVGPTGDRLILREGDGFVLDVRLSPGWSSTADTSFASSATTLPDGRVAVDLVLLETPHRLEIVLDPTAQTFTTRWPAIPLFSGDALLSSMRAPA